MRFQQRGASELLLVRGPGEGQLDNAGAEIYGALTGENPAWFRSFPVRKETRGARAFQCQRQNPGRYCPSGGTGVPGPGTFICFRVSEEVSPLWSFVSTFSIFLVSL